MKVRSFVAVATAAALAMTACGGSDKSGTMSEDEFVAAMADICGDTEHDLDLIDEPQTLADIEGAATEAIEILTDTRDRLAQLDPPEDVADEFTDFRNNVDDHLDAMEDLQKAGKDEDEAAVNDLSAELGELSNRRSDLADAMGVDECVNDDTTDPATTDPVTSDTGAALPGTVPATNPPLTLPPTVPPTVAPETVPPETTPTSGQLFTVVDLTTEFVAPDGFSLVNGEPTAAQAFIDQVAAIPALNTGIDSMGVTVLLNDTGDPIATIVLGIAIGDAMPGEWKDLLCGTDGILRTSSSGFTGIFCPGSDGTEIFTLTSGDVGLSVVTLVPDLPADLVVDAFYEANF